MHAPQDFAVWLGALIGRPALNDPSLMRWNLSKRYLMRLAAKGAPLAPTRFAGPHAAELARAMDELGLTEAVAKPVISAGGIGLSIMRRDNPESLEKAAKALGGSCLVQPLIPEIRDPGETSLVFLEGTFSHAVVKRPTGGGILCQSEHGGEYAEVAPPPFAVAEAQRILALLPATPFYARLDAIILDDALILMEVELIEPELFFDRIPAAAEKFAAAVDRKLGL
jgi:glutathione synthase/RimK-type ligase-like ATP-grasp enzyme